MLFFLSNKLFLKVVLSFPLEIKGNPSNISIIPLKNEEILIQFGKKIFLADYSLKVFPQNKNKILIFLKRKSSKPINLIVNLCISSINPATQKFSFPLRMRNYSMSLLCNRNYRFYSLNC
jgi:hypothetical protein